MISCCPLAPLSVRWQTLYCPLSGAKCSERTIEEVETGNEIVQVPIMLQKTAERKIKPVRIKYKDMELEIPCGMGTEDILAVLRAVKLC